MASGGGLEWVGVPELIVPPLTVGVRPTRAKELRREQRATRYKNAYAKRQPEAIWRGGSTRVCDARNSTSLYLWLRMRLVQVWRCGHNNGGQQMEWGLHRLHRPLLPSKRP